MNKKHLLLNVIFLTLPLIFIVLFLVKINFQKREIKVLEGKLETKIEEKETPVSSEVKYNIISLPFSYIDDSSAERRINDRFNTAYIYYGLSFAENMGNYLYISKESEITVPSLLSDYEFILIANTDGKTEYQGGGLRSRNLTPILYEELESIENKDIKGRLLKTDDGYWLEAVPVRNGENYYAAIYARSESKAGIEELIKIASGYEKVSYPGSYSKSSFFNEMSWLRYKPNRTDSTGKYRFYLPDGYKESLPEYNIGSYNYKDTKSGAYICIGLKGIGDGDSCGFSTSGCTCCNSGCGLVDIVMLVAGDGSIYLEPVLQKGVGTSTAGPRFLYVYPNHWLNLTSSFSIGDGIKNELGDYKKVLDLIHMVDSLDRTY